MGSDGGRIAGLLGLIAFAGCSSSSPPAESAILITIDTWRADRFGAGGHPDVRTPHLDRFFRGGTQFVDAWAPIPTTLASHASLLTGEWPTGHGVPRNGWPVPEDVVTIAELLGEEGFSTAAFVSSAALDPGFRLGQGFDVYDFASTARVERDQNWRPAPATLERAQRWWESTPGRRLLWVHFFEPHFPYDPDPVDFALYDTGYRGPADGSMDFLFAAWADSSLLQGGARAHLEALYHAEITGLDRKLGRFLDALAVEHRLLTILTADHGESLGEHGLSFKHGPHVFAGDVSVPLVARGVAPFGPGVSDAVVRTVDVPGTILDLLGVEANLPEGAAALTPSPGHGGDRLSFAEASMPWNVEEAGLYANAHKQRVIRTRDWTYVETPFANEKLWFDRRRDPGERRPAAGPGGEEKDRLTRELTEWIARGTHRPAPSTVDPELIEQLRALGYIE